MINTLLEALISKIRLFLDNYAPYTTEEERDYSYYNMVMIRQDLDDPELIQQLDDILKDFKTLEDLEIIELPEIPERG